MFVSFVSNAIKNTCILYSSQMIELCIPMSQEDFGKKETKYPLKLNDEKNHDLIRRKTKYPLKLNDKPEIYLLTDQIKFSGFNSQNIYLARLIWFELLLDLFRRLSFDSGRFYKRRFLGPILFSKISHFDSTMYRLLYICIVLF